MPRLPRLALATAAALLLTGSQARADVPRLDTVLLPPTNPAVAARLDASHRTWLVGARPSRASARVARRHGARRAGHVGWEVRAIRARALTAALRRRGLLLFAEPNRPARRAQAADPLSAAPPWPRGWRAAVVDSRLTPPAVTPGSPMLALVDSPADLTHPELAGTRVTRIGGGGVHDSHGTATAAVAAAAANGVGMLGVWPGMRALNITLPATDIDCADSTRGIARAVREGAAVLNMSYGDDIACLSEYVELQYAFAAGVTAVAAAGNEFTEGNVPQFPASLPHVVTVASVGPDGEHSFFSTAGAAIDLSAPGEDVTTAVPAAFDEDGTRDGYERVSGTSFSAPIVAAAAAWLRAERPELSVDQVANVLRLSAVDLGRKGWDPSTGFGLLSVRRALRERAPLRDHAEPNDDMPWVDGTAFVRAARPIYRRGRTARLRALLDRFEDPSDVYRVLVPARRGVRVAVRPRFGDPDVALYDGDAHDIRDERELLDLSARRGRDRTDVVTVRNARRRAHEVYVRVYVDASARTLDSAYTLTVTRR